MPTKRKKKRKNRKIKFSEDRYIEKFYMSGNKAVIPVELKVIQQPNFSIGENIISCIYDSVKTIEATDFEPAINENSYIGWTIVTKKESLAYPDNSEHAITPSDLINEVGTFTISAYYRYKYDNVYCNSNTKSITYTVKNRAHTPIVFSSVICKGEEIKDLQALGSPNMSWISLSGTKPIYASGMTYKFESQDLDTGIYKFEIFDILTIVKCIRTNCFYIVG